MCRDAALWYGNRDKPAYTHRGKLALPPGNSPQRSVRANLVNIEYLKNRLARLGRAGALSNPTLLAVSLTVFAAYTGIGMVGTVRVLYTESRGASLALISLMGSAYLVSTFAFQYPIGWLGDRWERKQIMVISLLAQAILTGLYLFVTDPLTFVVLRFFEGIAAAGMLPSARAMITEAVPVEQQGEAFGVFGAFFNIGFLLGPGIGGILAATGYTSTFIIAIIFRLVAVVLILTMIRTTKQGGGRSVEKPATPIPFRMLLTPALMGGYLVAFGNFLYMGFEITLFPLWMHDHLGASVALIGIAYMMFAIPNVILSPFTGRLADRTRRSLLILVFGLAQVPLYITYGLTYCFCDWENLFNSRFLKMLLQMWRFHRQAHEVLKQDRYRSVARQRLGPRP